MADGDKKEWKPDPQLLKEEEKLIKQYQNSKRQASPGAPLSLDDFWAYLPEHKYIFTDTGELWPKSIMNSVLGRVPLFHSDGAPMLDEKGERKTIAPSVWLDQNKSIHCLVWDPGEPDIIPDKIFRASGWVSAPGRCTYNFYLPPPDGNSGNPEAAQPWIDHIRYLYLDGWEEIIRWLAYVVQHPGGKINHILVLGGAQGIGKDTLLEPIKRTLGRWNCQEITPTEMMSPYNPFLKAVLICINEGRDLGEQDRYKYYDHTKTYYTAPPDVLRINDKYRPQHYIPNCCSFVMTTNYNGGEGIFLPEDDRRHFFCWSTRTRDDFDEDYFEKQWSFIDSGGDQHVAAYLRSCELTDFDPKAPPRQTQAFLAVAQSHQPAEYPELADVLDRMKRPLALTVSSIILTANENGKFALADWLSDRKNSRIIPHRLREQGYTRVSNPDDKTGYWHNSTNARIAIYASDVLAPDERIDHARKLIQS